MRLRGTTRLLALPVVAAGLMVSSCGATATKPPPVTGSTSPSLALHPPPSIAPARPPGTPVGATQRVPAAGTTLVVTVTKVIDPLRGSGAKVPAGMAPVAILITARNAGPGGYDSSYTSDFSLLSPAGRAMAVFAPAGVCKTYVQDFMNQLGRGQTRTGCIVYLVPRGKAPTSVRLAPNGGTAGHSVSWAIR